MNNNYPRLYLGVYATEFKKRFCGKIFDLNIPEDLETFYSREFNEFPIVIDNIDRVDLSLQSSIKSFLEDEYRVILLSSGDNISLALMGVIPFIFKKDLNHNSKFGNIIQRDLLNNLSECDKIKYELMNSPILYMNDMITNNSPFREKFIKILDNEYRPKN